MSQEQTGRQHAGDNPLFFKGDDGVAKILLEASMQLEILSKQPAYTQWCR